MEIALNFVVGQRRKDVERELASVLSQVTKHSLYLRFDCTVVLEVLALLKAVEVQ